MEEILNVQNLTKKIKGKTILNDVSFSVNAGEIYGFLGPNGAGKTTVIKCIMGLIKNKTGKITVCGIDVDKNYEKAAEKFGGIIENPEMYGNLSAEKNLKILSAMYKGITKEQIYNMLEKVGLKGHEKEKVKTFSLGMKQRLGIAQALIHSPRLLILDEPTNGLDPIGIKELRNMLKELAREKSVAVLVSSHQLSEMNLMCDRFCIIDKGVIKDVKNVKDLEEDKFRFVVDNIEKTTEVLTKNNLKFTVADNAVIVEIEEAKVATLNRFLGKFNINVSTIEKETKTIEDIFLEEVNNETT